MSKGQFQRTPLGQKTQKMKQVEQKLGRTLEEDYREFYCNQKWGQKKLADRWGIARGLVFGGNLGPGRRSWVEMLNLEVRNREAIAEQSAESEQKNSECPVCSIGDIPLDSAHWIPREKDGPTVWWNLAPLCPNCHRRLDSSNSQTTKAVRTFLVSRAADRYIAKNPRMTPEEFEDIVSRILGRT